MPVALSLEQIEADRKAIKVAMQAAGIPPSAITSIETRALRTAKKVGGEHATNRESRWKIPATHPQYGTEADCKAIFVKLCAQIFCFDNAPFLGEPLRIMAAIRRAGREGPSSDWATRMEQIRFGVRLEETVLPTLLSSARQMTEPNHFPRSSKNYVKRASPACQPSPLN